MKRCHMCGAAMRTDAELVEGDRKYTWFKCININCGSIFLYQEFMKKKAAVPEVVPPSPDSSGATDSAA